jgi:hypothetical protein
MAIPFEDDGFNYRTAHRELSSACRREYAGPSCSIASLQAGARQRTESVPDYVPEPSIVCASSQLLFLKRARNNDATCR